MAASATEETEHAPPDEASGRPSKAGCEGSLGRFLSFALDYWRGRQRRTAWLLTGAVLAIMAATLAVNLGLNAWNHRFYDALEKRDIAGLWSAALWLPPLIAAGAGLAVLMIRARMARQVHWRAFATGELIQLWLGNQRYYGLAIADRTVDNAEHRIAEDVRLATEPAIELSVGLLWSVASALAFIGVLSSVGGSLSVGSLAVIRQHGHPTWGLNRNVILAPLVPALLDVAHGEGLETFRDRKLTIGPSGRSPKLALRSSSGIPSRFIGALRGRRAGARSASVTQAPRDAKRQGQRTAPEVQ